MNRQEAEQKAIKMATKVMLSVPADYMGAVKVTQVAPMSEFVTSRRSCIIQPSPDDAEIWIRNVALQSPHSSFYIEPWEE